MNIKKVEEGLTRALESLRSGDTFTAENIIENLLVILKQHRQTSAQSWQKCKEDYFTFLKAYGKVKTVKDHRIKLEKAEEFFKEKYGYLPNPQKITEKEAAEYLYWLRTKGYDRNYYRRVFATFVQFLSFSMNPRTFKLKLMIPKAAKKAVQYLSIDDVKKALFMFGKDNFEELKCRTLLWIYAWTGLRYAEGLMLKRDDVDLKNNIIIVRKGKGDQGRNVYIPSALKRLLEEYIEQWEKFMKLRKEMGLDISEYLFFWIKRDGSLMDPYPEFRGYFMRFYKRAKKVGIEKFNVKKFRSTVTKLLAEIGGLDLSKVSAQLGHTKTSTTEEYYYRMGPTGLERPYEKIEKLLLDEEGEP